MSRRPATSSARRAIYRKLAQVLGGGRTLCDVVRTTDYVLSRVDDALVAWGTPERIAARIQEHLDAGADHVAVQVLGRASIATRLVHLRSLMQAL